MTETRRTYCGLCHLRCGARLRMEDGRQFRLKETQIIRFFAADFAPAVG